MDRPFPAYKGEEPYVFVSYAHKDATSVYPELTWLNDRSINVWYDEGIDAGTEWREELAGAIKRASLFIYFITPESVRSENCRKEVSFAIDQKIPLIAVHLAPTDLPDGLNLTLSDRQAILKHEIPDKEYREKLLNRIASYLDKQLVQESPKRNKSHEERLLDSISNRSQRNAKMYFEIDQIERLAPPRRSFGMSLIFMMFMPVLGFAVGFFIPSDDSYYLQPDEMVDTKSVVLALDKKETREIESLWNGLDKPTRELITNFVAGHTNAKPLPFIEHKLRRNVNSLIGTDVFLLGPLDPLWGDDIEQLHLQHISSDDRERINRAVLDLMFKDELKRWTSPPDLQDALDRLHRFLTLEEGGHLVIIVFVVIILLGAYMYTLGSIRVSFKDIKSVEQVLEYLVSEMGFKPPTREKDVLIFRATLTTILLYSVLKLRVTTDGNRILLTAPLPIIRRIRKRLLSLSR